MTEQQLRENEFFQSRLGGGIRSRPSRKEDIEEATMYTQQSPNYFNNNMSYTAPQFGLPSQNNDYGLGNIMQTQTMNGTGYGGLFGGIGNFGSGVLDKISEWGGKQGVTDWAKLGLGIKDTFFDRPKLINSYLDQGSALTKLRGAQTAAINENIAGAKRNEAAQNARTAAFDYSQRLV
ncbi:hypothetical protein OAW27_00200 [bacterium]|nr:hypothetical protein [bacterium]